MSRPTTLILIALLLGTVLAGCKTRWDVEDRESTAEVWLEAPAAAQAEVTVPVSVSVGETRAVDRTVRFPRGQTRIAVAPVYVKSGTHEVSVRIAGREVARGSASIKHHAWILVRIQGQGAEILALDREPGTR